MLRYVFVQNNISDIENIKLRLKSYAIHIDHNSQFIEHRIEYGIWIVINDFCIQYTLE